MKLNSRSCVLDAFARIMGVPPHILATQCGHWGRDGYHTQELIQVALSGGYAVTPIERTPVSQNPETGAIEGVEFPGFDEPEDRFIKWLIESRGVLLGYYGLECTQKTHAVAWDGQKVFDSGVKMKYDLIFDGEICETSFTPHTLLRMDKL